jgi:hypothetical protein
MDEIDAAARILDPIFSSISESADNGVDGSSKGGKKKKKDPEYGHFYKDYHSSEW